jgi:hypothetical protein
MVLHSEYLVSNSEFQHRLLIVAYLLALVCILIFIDSISSLLILIALTLLFAVRDFMHRIQQTSFYLRMNPVSKVIEIEKKGRIQSYGRFDLFPTRYFILVRLKNEDGSQGFLLTPSQFETDDTYRSFRHDLNLMKEQLHAT